MNHKIILFKKYSKILFELAKIITAMPICIPIIFVLRLIKPIIHIRLRMIHTGELGHFVLDSGILLSEFILKGNKNKIKDWYWLGASEKWLWSSGKENYKYGEISNYKFKELVERVFYVRWWVKYLYVANNIIPGGNQHTGKTLREIQSSRDINGALYKTKELKEAYFKFTEEEHAEAKKYLKDIGLNERDKFVCLVVRDDAYKEKFLPAKKWSYHSYRDSDIDTYSLAVTALAERGYWVFRMGKLVSKPFNCKNPKVIDYAWSNEKSELLDIWLSAHCEFCIDTGTGPGAVSYVFRKPILIINNLPSSCWDTFSHTIICPKNLRWKKNKKHLSLKEYLEHDYYHSEKYEKNGIEIINLEATEIKEAVLEMEKRTTGRWEEKPEDKKMQEKVWKLYKNLSKYQGFIHPETKISTVFLRSKPNWVD